jgi:hypothetical protein
MSGTFQRCDIHFQIVTEHNKRMDMRRDVNNSVQNALHDLHRKKEYQDWVRKNTILPIIRKD